MPSTPVIAKDYGVATGAAVVSILEPPGTGADGATTGGTAGAVPPVGTGGHSTAGVAGSAASIGAPTAPSAMEIAAIRIAATVWASGEEARVGACMRVAYPVTRWRASREKFHGWLCVGTTSIIAGKPKYAVD
mgnify:CR=1 FL=1